MRGPRYKNAKAVRSDIRKAIGSAQSAVKRPPRRRDPDGNAGLPVSVLNARDRATRRLIERHAKKRHERLEALLRARRLHVTQMSAHQLGDRVVQDI